MQPTASAVKAVAVTALVVVVEVVFADMRVGRSTQTSGFWMTHSKYSASASVCIFVLCACVCVCVCVRQRTTSNRRTTGTCVPRSSLLPRLFPLMNCTCTGQNNAKCGTEIGWLDSRGATRISCFLDRMRRNVRSFVGSMSRTDDLVVARRNKEPPRVV